MSLSLVKFLYVQFDLELADKIVQTKLHNIFVALYQSPSAISAQQLGRVRNLASPILRSIHCESRLQKSDMRERLHKIILAVIGVPSLGQFVREDNAMMNCAELRDKGSHFSQTCIGLDGRGGYTMKSPVRTAT